MAYRIYFVLAVLVSFSVTSALAQSEYAPYKKVIKQCEAPFFNLIEDFRKQKEAEAQAWKAVSKAPREGHLDYLQAVIESHHQDALSTAAGFKLLGESLQGKNGFEGFASELLNPFFNEAALNQILRVFGEKAPLFRQIVMARIARAQATKAASEALQSGASSEKIAALTKEAAVASEKSAALGLKYETLYGRAAATEAAEAVAEVTSMGELFLGAAVKAGSRAANVLMAANLLTLDGTDNPHPQPAGEFCTQVTKVPKLLLNPYSAIGFVRRPRILSRDGSEIIKQSEEDSSLTSRLITYCTLAVENPDCFNRAKAALFAEEKKTFLEQLKGAQLAGLSNKKGFSSSVIDHPVSNPMINQRVLSPKRAPTSGVNEEVAKTKLSVPAK